MAKSVSAESLFKQWVKPAIIAGVGMVVGTYILGVINKKTAGNA